MSAPERLLRRAEVEQLTGLATSTIYKLMAQTPPEFPRPVRVTNTAVRWKLSSVSEWIDAMDAKGPEDRFPDIDHDDEAA